MYLIGYDHNILHIKHWKEDPCPNKSHINVEVHLPEIENTEVCYPELSDDNIDSFLLKNVRYPVLACENLMGGKVLVSFIVETDGSISNIEIVRSVHDILSRGVIRGIKLTDSKWISGMENGEKIPMKIKIEFNFNIGDGCEDY
jgi:TonB family C-terminal domain